MSDTVDQSGASAGGDVVAGNKIVYNHNYTAQSSKVVEQLLEKLKAEIDKDAKVKSTIENLKFFYVRKSHDGVDGLEAKLIKGNRENELLHALEKKELFVKLLEKWSLYASAQEIFAYLLAKAEYEFTTFVFPKIGKVEDDQINTMVHDKIIAPTLLECGQDIFTLNHSVAMGMIYWLAEQCFIRWHQ